MWLGSFEGSREQIKKLLELHGNMISNKALKAM